MRMPQSANLTTHTVLTRDVCIVLHNHVEVRTNEPQWRAVKVKEGVEIRPFPDCQFHKRGAIARKEFVDFSDDCGLVRNRRDLNCVCQTGVALIVDKSSKI
jgi:hypothetical protein